MSDNKPILVGIDGSGFSPSVLRLAGRFASVLEAPLKVVTCLGMSDFYLPAHLPPGYIDSAAELEAIAKRLVEQAIDRAYASERPQNLSTEVTVGSPAKVLVDESRNAQMLVVGRRGHGGLLGQFMGSVSAACAAHAHCPVLVVAEESEGPLEPRGAEQQPIVVGVDGSDPSVLALRWAGALAPLFQARIRAVTAWQFQIAVGTFTPVLWHPEEEAGKICAEAVGKAFKGVPPAGLERVVTQGPAAKLLIEESSGAQLVVVGSRGYGGFEGLLLGAVSATVAEHAKCPVFIAHGTDLPAGLSAVPGQASAEGGGQGGVSHAWR